MLASVASAEIADAEEALDAAQDAFADWASRTPRARSEILRKAYELMIERQEEFARLITLENGKAGNDARGEAAYAAEFFRWFSEEAVRVDGLITHAPASGARIVVQHKPAGIAVLVTPWNYPAAMGTRKIAPAFLIFLRNSFGLSTAISKCSGAILLANSVISLTLFTLINRPLEINDFLIIFFLGWSSIRSCILLITDLISLSLVVMRIA